MDPAPDAAARTAGSEFQRRVDAEDQSRQLNPLGLAWHSEVVQLAPPMNAKEAWLAPSAAAISELYEQFDADLSDPACSREMLHTLRARNYFEVASLFFDLFRSYNVELISAERWLRKCQNEMNAFAESSEEKKKLQNEAKHMREMITDELVAREPSKVLNDLLISGGVSDVIQGLKVPQKGEDWKRKAWSVLALRAITELCSTLSDISHSVFTNDEISVILHKKQLGELFFMLGKKALGNRYTRDSEMLKQLIGQPRQISEFESGLEESVEEIIKTSRSVNEVVRVLSAERQISLNRFDKSYLGIRLVRYNLKQLPVDVGTHLKEFDWKTTESIVASLGNITRLEDIPAPFKSLRSYQVLLGNKECVNNDEELKCISTFKITCLKHQISCFPKRDLDFLNALQKVMQTYRADIEVISQELGLQEFCQGSENACGKLVRRILQPRARQSDSSRDSALKSLRVVAEDLEYHPAQWFIEDQLKLAVSRYIRPAEPPEIQKVTLDGRQVIEVKGMKTKLSVVLPNILSMFENPRVEEIRFVVNDCLSLDANLNANRWHGINIWIQTDLLRVVGDVVLDVSGSNGTPMTYANRAADGSADGQDGKKGADGFTGESGGNVSIFAEKIEHPERLTVVSRGGDGGRGQDGGHGRKGKDGFSHTYTSLNNYLGQNQNTHWLHDPLVKTIESKAVTKKTWNPAKNFYHVVTANNCEIIYSYNWDTGYLYFFHTAFHNKSFFLHKGGPGMMGGRGGKPGKGGMGGYGGLVVIRSKLGHRAQEPLNGKAGEFGSPGNGSANGRSGYDIGFVPNATTAATWYGHENNNRKLLRVVYSDEKPHGEVWTWCPCYDKYAVIKSGRAEEYFRVASKMVTEETSKLETQAQANRKKNISAEHMLNTYQKCTYSVEEISLHRDNFEAALKKEEAELRSLSAVKVNENVKSNVHREKNSEQQPHEVPEDIEDQNVENFASLDEVSAEKFLADIESNPRIKMKWKALKNVIPNAEQFERLFNAQDNASIDDEARNILLYKYRTFSLQKIGKNGKEILELYSRDHSDGHIKKYLFEKEGYEVLPCEQEPIKNHFEKLKQANQPGNANQTLKLAIKYFAENDKEIHCRKVMTKYVEDCTDLVMKKEEAWRKYLDVLERNQPAYDLWVRAYNGEAVRDELRAAITQDVDAQAALVAFSAVPEYDWNAAAQDDEVLKEITMFLGTSGSLSSACYREVLTDTTKQHIRVYHRDEENTTYTLAAEHGAMHSSKMYLLQTSDGVVPLHFNQPYFDLECHQRRRNAVFAFVLGRVNALRTKRDIDTFVQKLLTVEESVKLDVDNFINEDRYDTDDDTDKSFAADVASVLQHFPRHKRSNLTDKLKLLDPRCSPNCVVANLARRLASEELRVSSEVISWLVDLAVQGAVADDGVGLGHYEFIVAVNNQADWAAELLILQLENHFRRILLNEDDMRANLGKISHRILILISNKLKKHTFSEQNEIQRDHITVGVVQDLIQKLTECEDDVFAQLRYVDVDEWTYALEEIIWRKKLEQLTAWKEDEELQASVHYLSTLARKIGMTGTKLILNNIAERNVSELTQTAILDLFFYISSDGCHLPNDKLPQFVSDLSFKDWENNGKKMLTLSQDDRNINDLSVLIKNNPNNSASFISLQTKIAAEFKDESSLKVTDMEKLCAKLNPRLSKDDSSTLKVYVNMVGIVNSVIKKTTGFNLRATQKLAALLLLENKNKSLMQVSTGEGKTMIVLVVAIIKALCGEKVHIVTSSSVLAKRDATSTNNLRIYKAFGISVSHNCSEDIEERKLAYSASQVVYGDLSNFQRDHLLDSFYQKSIMGDHTKKQNMIIDEVDSMLLDKGNNMLYLSHNIGDLDKLECVYAFIWQRINAPGKDSSERFDVKLIKNQVLLDLYGPITREGLKLLGSALSLVEVEEIWDRLRREKIIDEKGILIDEDNVNEASLDKVCKPPLKNRLLFLLEQQRDRVKSIEVPNFMKQFVSLHVEKWIENAIHALTMKVDQDYVVDVDRTEASVDVYPIVTILDKDTGTDQTNSQWDGGLHQFLQIKHGCKLSMQSLKAVFISNVTYFKQYDKIYGMTGTLGTLKEQEMLQNVHKVDFVTIPTSKPKQFVEFPPVVCANRCEWIAKVLTETSDMLDTKGRSALVICETIEEVRELTDAFRSEGRANVHVYTRDYETFALGGDNSKLEPGHVVVATNLAGRGTDIAPSNTLLKAGGLHVVLTYIPRNSRVEQQAFGRAARGGVPGSGRLVVLAAAAGGTSALRIADIRVKRDAKSQTKMEEFYKSQILGEEGFMKHFTGLYSKLESKLSTMKYPETLKKVLLQFYINKWALWLDTNEINIKTMTKTQLYASMGKELRLNDHISTVYKSEQMQSLLCVLDQPSIIIKIGKFLLDVNPSTSIIFFDYVKKSDPNFSEIALYYKCAARVQLMHKTQDNDQRKQLEGLIREDLRLAARAIDRRKSSLKQTARTTASICKVREVRVTTQDAIQIQTQNFVRVFEALEKSIDEICGAPMTAEELGAGDIELGAMVEKDLVRAGILKGCRITCQSKIQRRDLEHMSNNYGIPYESLKSFLSDKTDVNITDVNKFENELKTKLLIHNKEAFWEILTQKKLIWGELELVAIVKFAIEFENDYPNLKAISEVSKTKGTFVIYSDQIPASNEKKLLFTKTEFIAAVGDERYKELRKEGDAIDLKRAVLAKEQLLSTTFLWEDSITLQNLVDTRICHDDADIILRELEAQKIIEERKGKYFLVSHDFNSLHLSVPVYESTIRNFLAVSFAYDLALNRIRESVAEEADSSIEISLVSNPHRLFLMDMFECGVIERPRVDSERTDIANCLRRLYKNELTESEFGIAWNRNSPSTQISAQKVTELYRVLQTHRWLEGSRIASNDRRMSLASSTYSNIESALRRFFDAHLRVAGNVESMAIKLEHGRGLLSTLDCPVARLHLLSDEAQTQNVNIEELTVFELSSFEHLIILGEKKYTIWMILSAVAVIVMGICQIIVGAMMEIYSLGSMTLVAGSIIGEGIGDILYGISALCTGEFSWKDYGKQKAAGIMMSVVTMGVGAYFNRFVQASRYGIKLLGIIGSKVAGKVLLKEEGVKKLLRTVTKRIVEDAGKEAGKHVANIGADRLVDTVVKPLCAKAVATIVQKFDAEFDSSDALRSLPGVLFALGEDAGVKVVTEAVQNLIAPVGSTGEWEESAVKITKRVLEALSGESPPKTAAIDQSWSTVELQKVTLLSRKLCIELESYLNERKYEKKVQYENENYANFKGKVKEELKNILQEKITTMLNKSVVTPYLKRITDEVVNQRFEAKTCNRNFQEWRTNHKQQAGQQGTGESKTKQVWDGAMRKIMSRCKDPAKFEPLVLANDIALDSTGVQAVVSAVVAMSNTNIAVVIHGDGELSERIEATIDKSTNRLQEVHVGFRDGRFSHWGFSESEGVQEDGCNGHLFQALSPVLGGERSATQFQEHLAETIRTDNSVQRAIRRDWYSTETGGRLNLREQLLCSEVLTSVVAMEPKINTSTLPTPTPNSSQPSPSPSINTDN